MLNKKRILEIIDVSKVGDVQSKVFDISIIILIILNTLAIILESYESISLRYEDELRYFEMFSVIVFSIEYILRLWTANLKYGGSYSNVKSRIKHSLEFMSIIDILAILPFYLPMILPFDFRFIRIVRVTRILRIVKVNRYSKALKLISKVINNRKEELLATVFVMGFVIMMSATLMYYFENEVQPDAFPNIVASFWWAIATLTTVGYGDVYPVTLMGKILASVIAITGIGLVALPTGIISSGFVNELSTKNKSKKCPHCGEEIITDDI